MAKKKKALRQIAEDLQLRADVQIRERQKEVKYDLRDFTIDYIVEQFREGLFYIPEYQRKFVWTPKQRCLFVESVILGLPIPMMFVADMQDGRLEIVDGAQRIQTLEAFCNNDLRLQSLTQLTALDRFYFGNLPPAQQRKFGTKALRMVVLEDATTAEVRQEIFSRINTTGSKARAAEVRRGAHPGPLMNLVRQCAESPLFARLCPMNEQLRERREGEELALRFFAYSDTYLKFKHDVDKFLDAFVKSHRTTFDVKKGELEFERVLRFVERHFAGGFAKASGLKSTPRVRFEAIAVGVNLALRDTPTLHPADMTWLTSDEFELHTTTHASNSLSRLKGRIEFVRDKLLGKS